MNLGPGHLVRRKSVSAQAEWAETEIAGRYPMTLGGAYLCPGQSVSAQAEWAETDCAQEDT
jgi:hypothetical protein